MVVVIIMILFSFLQGAGLPVNLILLTLIARSFVVQDKMNFWLAFALGLFLSFLLNLPLGILSILYLLIIASIYAIKKARIASHPLILMLVSWVFLTLDFFALQLGGDWQVNIPLIIFELVLVIPVYLAVRFWEERFVPKGDVKLKIRK